MPSNMVVVPQPPRRSGKPSIIRKTAARCNRSARTASRCPPTGGHACPRTTGRAPCGFSPASAGSVGLDPDGLRGGGLLGGRLGAHLERRRVEPHLGLLVRVEAGAGGH